MDTLVCKDEGNVAVRADGGCLICNADAGEACRLVTEFIYWQATLAGYEPGDPIGHGATRGDAIRDLMIEIESHAP